MNPEPPHVRQPSCPRRAKSAGVCNGASPSWVQCRSRAVCVSVAPGNSFDQAWQRSWTSCGVAPAPLRDETMRPRRVCSLRVAGSPNHSERASQIGFGVRGGVGVGTMVVSSSNKVLDMPRIIALSAAAIASRNPRLSGRGFLVSPPLVLPFLSWAASTTHLLWICWGEGLRCGYPLMPLTVYVFDG